MADTVEKVTAPGCYVDEQSFINLNQRVCDLEALTDEDDQQLSLAGNILTLEDGGTVDLSVFLDDADEQTITAFTLSPAGVLTLAIENGNTVNLDLSSLDTDTDDQTLSIAGNLLSIADGNAVDLSAIDTDDQTLSLTGTVLSIQDGNSVDLANLPLIPVYEYETIWGEEGGGASDNSSQYSFGNGATGTIGIPVGDGWELVEVGTHWDNGGSAAESMVVGVMDFQNNTNTVLTNITLTAAGDGQDNNSFIRTVLPSPVPVPGGAVIGFRSINETGAYSNGRALARYRRKVADVFGVAV